MTMEQVYKYRHYDIQSDEYVYSSRYATMHKINQIKGDPVYGTGIFLDAKYLKDGWTEKNFEPPKNKEAAN